MMIARFLIIVGILISTSAFAQEKKTAKIDINGVTWDSTVPEIEKLLGPPLLTEAMGRFDRHRYIVYVNKVSVAIDIVVADQIEFIIVQLMPLHKIDPVAKKWLAELSKKYGEPNANKDMWWWTFEDKKRIWLKPHFDDTVFLFYIRDRETMREYYRIRQAKKRSDVDQIKKARP